MFGFFKKRLCEDEKKNNSTVLPLPEKQPSEPRLSDFVLKLESIISGKNTEFELINETEILYRGQGYSDWPLKGAFWSTRISVAENHANRHKEPYILRGTPKPRLKLAKSYGFVDCLIAILPEDENSDLYGRVCAELEKLNNEGFFEKFTDIDGIVDTTASFDGGHEKIYLFSSGCLRQLLEP
jgi:hypothetical protein